MEKIQKRHFAAALLACVAAALSAPAIAQITEPQGAGSQESRASNAADPANPSGATLHESQRPQSKDAAGAARGPTVGKAHSANGAGGFDNGLYGTGAGNNK